MKLSDRSTVDLVTLIFSMLIFVMLVLTIIGAVVLKILDPAIDLSKTVESVSQTIATIVGALVGFVGGRAYGMNEIIQR